MFLMIPLLSVGKKCYFILLNNKDDNILFCAKMKYGQIVETVILATSNRWFDVTMRLYRNTLWFT